MCKKLHDENPYSLLIGWVAIDRSASPVLMEWNQIWGGIALSEASLGPCFSNLGWEHLNSSGKRGPTHNESPRR